jgi:simple sugar transport system ATP-binding protein
MAEPPVVIRNISHVWPGSGLQVCHNVSLQVGKPGVHALVGENGAGKTTLGHIASGVLTPDSGYLLMDGHALNLAENRRGLIDGVGLIRQRSIWPPALTILEAAVLGRPGTPPVRRKQIRLFSETAVRWGLEDVDPLRSVAGTDAATLQRAEMVAALMFSHRFIILDEPSSAWEEGRSEEFFNLLNRLRDSGCGILLITHRLEDVFRIADEVTVMRHGRVVGSWDAGSLDYTALTGYMFGEGNSPQETVQSPDIPAGRHNPEENSPVTKAGESPGGRSGESAGGSGVSPGESSNPLRAESTPVLELRNAGITAAGRTELQNISFSLSPGEILGITGLKEEGLRFLEDLLSGNRRADTGGLYVDSRLMKGGSPAMRRAGLRYVPSDKTGRGSSLSSTMTENLLLLESRRLSRRGWLHPERVRKWTDAGRRAAGIIGGPDQRMVELSGGNIQKVILQRELERHSRLLVASDPAWGLDEQSRRHVHLRIRQMRDEGTAVLLLASDLDEALDLSDRLGVISRGRLSEIRKTSLWNRREVAGLIAGGRE